MLSRAMLVGVVEVVLSLWTPKTGHIKPLVPPLSIQLWFRRATFSAGQGGV